MALIGEANSGAYSRADVDRKRKLAEMLMRDDFQAREPFGALAKALTGARAGFENSQADAGEKQGNQIMANLLQNKDWQGVMGSEWATPQNLQMASMLEGRDWQVADRNAGWAREDARYAQERADAQAAASRPDYGFETINGDIVAFDKRNPGSGVQTVFDGPDQATSFRPMTAEEKAAAGLPPDVPAQIGPDGKIDVIGGRGVNVDVNNMGNIPSGYKVDYDADGNPVSMSPIPGSPAALEADAATRKLETGAGRKDTMTDTIIAAAADARKLATEGNTGLSGAVAGINPVTQAAELRRQTDVLKANATIENLAAMRAASPTGGALGSVTEKENAMLAAAAGAIDPNSSRGDYVKALDNYERTLLRIVHGPEAGDRIFNESRAPTDYKSKYGLE